MHRTLHHTCRKSFVKVDSFQLSSPHWGPCIPAFVLLVPVIPERQPAGHGVGSAERCGEIDVCVWVCFSCLPVHEPVRIAYDRPRGRPVSKKKVSMTKFSHMPVGICRSFKGHCGL